MVALTAHIGLLPNRTRYAIPDPGHLAPEHMCYWVWGLIPCLVEGMSAHSLCVCHTKKGKVKAMPGSDCLGFLGLLLSPAGTWAFTELSGTCPS